MEKRLYRSRTDRMLWGVAGGLGKYFGIDPVIVRLIFILLIFAGGFGIVAYIIMAIVVPLEGSKAVEPQETIRENLGEIKETATRLGQEVRSTFSSGAEKSDADAAVEKRRRNALGIILIIIGIIFLVITLNVFWWFEWTRLWPLILIAVGILLIVSFRKR